MHVLKTDTFSFQAPGLGNFRLTIRAELGIFSNSLRPCASPTVRPGNGPQEHLSVREHSLARHGGTHQKFLSRKTVRTKGIAELNLWRRTAEGHGDFAKARVEGHLPRVLLSAIVVRRQQVDLHSLDRLLHPFQNLERGKESRHPRA